MPQNFGDTFVQSMQFGAALAQKEEEHQATQALEALKMDALNRQITIADKTLQETMKSHATTATAEFNKAWIPTNRNNPYMKDQRLRTADELRSLHPGVNIPEGDYLDAQSMQGILGLMQMDRYNAAEQAKLYRQMQPQLEADALNAAFDSRGQNPLTTTKTTTKGPRRISQLWNALGQVKIPLPGLGWTKVATRDVINPTQDDKLFAPWFGYNKQQEKQIGEIPGRFVKGWNEAPNEVTNREIPNVQGIKENINSQAEVISAMLPRAKGENFPNYASSINAFGNMAERLVTYDEEGEPRFDSEGLDPTAARVALYTVISTHKTGYLNAMADAEATRKAMAMTDKDKAEEEYGLAKQKAEKEFPLHRQAIGQAFGQRYTYK